MGHDGQFALAPTSRSPASLTTLKGTHGKARSEREGQLEIGSIVGGRYEIAEFVAAGAFGAVYRANDLDVSGHVVALKLMHRPAASEAEHHRCLREVQLIAAVSHPSVVSFKDHGLHRGRLYIVMPWYEGESLAQRIASRGALSRSEAASIFKRLAEALAAMHERGIRHQDVKPENILLARFGAGQEDFPVLLDLGVGAIGDELLPAFTAAYVAPEMAGAHLQMCAGEKPMTVDGKADVFALALTLFDALAPSARAISTADASPEGLARRAVRGAELPQVPALADIAASLGRWLAVDPRERPTAREMVAELSALTRAEERREERRRMLMRVGPVLTVVLAVVAVLAAQLRKERVSSRVKDARIEQQAAEIDSAREAIDVLSGERRTREQQMHLALEHKRRAEALLTREIASKDALQRALSTEQRLTRELKRGLADASERTLALENELRALDDEVTALRDEHHLTGEELARAREARRTLNTAYERSRAEAKRLGEELQLLEGERARMLERIAALEQSESALSAEVTRLRGALHDKPRREAVLQELEAREESSSKSVL